MTQKYLRLRPDIVPLQWHEAVAVVQAVARQLLASGDDGPVPAATSLAVDHNGGVHIVDSRQTRSATGDGPAALGALLQELLRFSSSTPPALGSLADGTDGTSARFRSVEEFSKALQFFERPLSQHDLAAHAARLATTHEQSQLNAELEQLTQKARDADAQPQKKETGSAGRRRSNGRKVAIAVLVCGFLIVAIFAGALAGWNTIGTESMREVGSRLVERARREAKAVLANDAPPVPPKESTAATERPLRHRRRSVARSENRPTASMLPAVALPVVTAARTEAPLELTVEDVPPEVVAERSPDAVVKPSIYSRANREVEPPVIMRPQIRSEPPARPRETQPAVLVLDIDEQGAVGQVRLRGVSAEERYHAGMMVAAAKAWRFRPALKDGKPVRYRLWLPVSP
jgi:hypothetical protein